MSRGIDQAVPLDSVTRQKLELLQKEHEEFLETRLKLLHPGKVGRHYPVMHVPLIPGRTVRMPLIDKKVIEGLGYAISVLKSYDVDYFGAKNLEEFDHAKAAGLVRFPGLWFSVLGERE